MVVVLPLPVCFVAVCCCLLLLRCAAQLCVLMLLWSTGLGR
jgi:hypothetical protein